MIDSTQLIMLPFIEEKHKNMKPYFAYPHFLKREKQGQARYFCVNPKEKPRNQLYIINSLIYRVYSILLHIMYIFNTNKTINCFVYLRISTLFHKTNNYDCK